MARSACLALFFCLGLAASISAGEKKAPVELGKVPWIRDYAVGVAKAGEDKKPILLLFQEVPG